MKKNKSLLIGIIFLLLLVTVSVFLLITNINKKNKNDILFSVADNSTSLVLDAEHLETLCSFVLSGKIKNLEPVKNTVKQLLSDNDNYLRIKQNRALLLFRKDNKWVLMVKYGSVGNIKLSDLYISHLNTYTCLGNFKLSKRSNVLLNNKISLTKIINSRINTSNFHIIESISNETNIIWAGHDLHFTPNGTNILSLYSFVDDSYSEISKNNSNVIKSFESEKKAYSYYKEGNLSMSALSTSFFMQDLAEQKNNEELPNNNNIITIENISPAETTEEDSKLNNIFFTAKNEITKGPFFVNNHTNKQGNILLQDKDFSLYFLTFNGEIKWTLNLQSEIIGDISEIDFFQNNKTQYIFNTKNHIYIVSILGDVLKGFPIKLPVETKSKVLIKLTDSENFNAVITTNNDAVFAKYSNGEFKTIKSADINNTTQNSNNFPSLILDKFIAYNNPITLYDFNGNVHFKINSDFLPSENVSIYNNETNNKSNYICNDCKGRLSYLSDKAQIQYTEFDKFSSNNIFIYTDVNNNKEKDFVFVENGRIVAFDKFKNKIFESDIEIDDINNVKTYKNDNNSISIIIFSQAGKKAIIAIYDNSKKKISYRKYASSTMPIIINKCTITTDKNKLLIEN